MSEICENKKVNLMYHGEETVGEIVSSPMVGEKIKVSGMLLEPYEGVLEESSEDLFRDIPEETPGDEWMED
jgi:hypothetical protein